MSAPMALEPAARAALVDRQVARLAVLLAFPLSRLAPDRLTQVLRFLRRGAQPASVSGALSARQAVVAVSTACAGQACLQRSIATAVACRLRGNWPTWCTGVRVLPFRAHAWVEVDGRPVGEDAAVASYVRVLVVPPPGHDLRYSV